MRLSEAAAGMPAGSEGVVLGWYPDADRALQAIVSFWDGGPLRVPIELLERVSVGNLDRAALARRADDPPRKA